MKYRITTISALNQLFVITNLPTVNPDEKEVVESWDGETEVTINQAIYVQSNRPIVYLKIPTHLSQN